MTRIKICGLRRPEDAESLNRLAVDYAGFVLAPSKRQVTPRQALEIKKELSPLIRTVGVYVNAPLSDIVEAVTSGLIDLVQLHGDEDAHYIRQLRDESDLPIIKACGVRSTADIYTANLLDCDYLLLDTYTKERGGSGKVFDYRLIPPLSRPFFLAGGLRAENVRVALERNPFAVDASSGLETDGYKDEAKVTAFVEAVRQYDAEGKRK